MHVDKPNGLLVSAEVNPWIGVGGLGPISRMVPEMLSDTYDLRVMMPMTNAMYTGVKDLKRPKLFGDTDANYMELRRVRDMIGKGDIPAFKPTGLKTTLDYQDDTGEIHTEPFELYESKTPAGVTVYAIHNDHWFGQLRNLYPDTKTPVPHVGHDALFKVNMMFSRAAAAFAPMLTADAKRPKNAQVTPFNGNLDFVVANDWETGPVLNELAESKAFHPGKVFYVHNLYNETRLINPLKPDKSAPKTEGPPPTLARDLKLKPPKVGYVDSQGSHLYAPLNTGIQQADVVIMNDNYAKQIQDIYKTNPPVYLKTLKHALVNGKIKHMVHPLEWDDRNPSQVITTSEDGFWEKTQGQYPDLDMMAEKATLPRFVNLIRHDAATGKPIDPNEKTTVGTLDEIKTMKQHNKHALQALLNRLKTLEQPTRGHQGGFKVDPEATVFCWGHRFEPYQKGVALMMQTLPKMMEAHPDMQLIMFGGTPPGAKEKFGPLVDSWIQMMNERFGERVYIVDDYVDHDLAKLVHSGSDYLINE